MTAINSVNQEAVLGFIRNSLLGYSTAMFPDYKPGLHHKLLASKLEQIESGKLKRLAVLLPPRHGKTLLATQLFASWYLGKNPKRRILSLSYGQELSDTIGRVVRNHLKSQTFEALFPGCQLAADSNSVRRFNTSVGGAYASVGVGGPTTGKGADLLLIDDVIKDRQEADSIVQREALIDWFKAVARTRLQPQGSIVLVQTRWGVNDFVSWLLTETAHEDWDVVSLPALALPGDLLERKPGEALWPSSYPVEALEAIRGTLGSRDWQALYQQCPLSDSDVIVRKEWLRLYTQSPFARTITADLLGMPDTEFETVASWDLTFGANKQTSSWVVGQVWARNRRNSFCYLVHQFREQIGFVDSIRAITEVNERFRPTATLIENKALGGGAIEVLRDVVPNLKAVEPLGGKEDRLYRVIPKFERGEVWLPDPKLYPWAKPLMTEIESFPMSQSDDCIDSMSQALGYFQQYDANNWLQIYSMRS